MPGMQGKACFNFSEVDKPLFDELATLTQRGVIAYASAGFSEFRIARAPWLPGRLVLLLVIVLVLVLNGSSKITSPSKSTRWLEVLFLLLFIFLPAWNSPKRRKRKIKSKRKI